MSVRDIIFYIRPTYTTFVSILVLVDVGPRYSGAISSRPIHRCFNPCFSGCRSAIVGSIDYDDYGVGFNPCFSGCRSAIFILSSLMPEYFCFNPCFSGCRSAISLHSHRFNTGLRVSILVLVDVGPRLRIIDVFG